MPDLTPAQVQNLADELIGTSGVYDDSLAKDYGVSSSDLASIISDHGFSCSQCGWWCGRDEQAESDSDEVCDECAED